MGEGVGEGRGRGRGGVAWVSHMGSHNSILRHGFVKERALGVSKFCIACAQKAKLVH